MSTTQTDLEEFTGPTRQPQSPVLTVSNKDLAPLMARAAEHK